MRNTETAMLSHSLLQPNAKATNEEKSTFMSSAKGSNVISSFGDVCQIYKIEQDLLSHLHQRFDKFGSTPNRVLLTVKVFYPVYPVQLVIWLLHWLPFFNLFAILFFLSNLFAFLFVVLSCLLSWLWFYLVCLLGCYHFCSLAASSVDCKCWYATPKVHHHIIVSITIIFSI